MARNRILIETRSTSKPHVVLPVKSASSRSPCRDAFGSLILLTFMRRASIWLCVVPFSIYIVFTVLLLERSLPRDNMPSVLASCSHELRCFLHVPSTQHDNDNNNNDYYRTREKLPSAFRPLALLVDKSRMFRPNYGGLHYQSCSPSLTFERTVQLGDSELYHKERLQELDHMDRHASETDVKYDHFDDLDWPRKCYRARSTYSIRPTCNDFHERALVVVGTDPWHASTYLGRGSYRTSWSLGDWDSSSDVNHTDIVLKSQRLGRGMYYEMAKFHAQIQVEALSLERTTDSDRTTNIYGHCGMSIFVERAFPIESTIIPDYSYYGPHLTTAAEAATNTNTHHSSNYYDGGGVLIRNNLAQEQKLAVALAMAEGLALLHGNYDGVIVNDDIQLTQWLLGRDGKVKLNDFNKAIIMEWNAEKQSYCTFHKEYSHSYRAPEELRGNVPVSEKADVFSFGQTLYTLLTGLAPFFERNSRDEALKANLNGELPYVDPRLRNRSLIEGRLVKIMESCYQHRPDDRISIFDVVALLRETVIMYEQQYPNATRIADVSLFDLREDGWTT